MTLLRDEPPRRRAERPLPRYPILGLATAALLGACQAASGPRAPAHSPSDTEGAEDLARTESASGYLFDGDSDGLAPLGWRQVEELRGPRARSESGPGGGAGAAGGPSPGPDEPPGP